MVAAAIVQSFLFQAVVILVVFLNAKALALDVPIAALAVFVPLISLAGMLPLSVNGLGIRDVLYVLLFGRLGVGADVAFALSVLYSAVTFAASLPGGVVYALRRGPGHSIGEDHMKSRALRAVFVLLALAAQAGAGYQVWRIDEQVSADAIGRHRLRPQGTARRPRPGRPARGRAGLRRRGPDA